MDGIVVMDDGGLPYGTTSGGYVYDVCRLLGTVLGLRLALGLTLPLPLPLPLSLPLGAGFRVVGSPGVPGDVTLPPDDVGLGPGLVPGGVVVSLDSAGGFERLPETWLLLGVCGVLEL